jgi:hypothetical protein
MHLHWNQTHDVDFMPMKFGEMSKPKNDSHDKESPVLERGLLK